MRTVRYVLLFLGLFAFWFVLSGHTSGLFLAMGAVSAALVTMLTGRLLEGVLGSAQTTPRVNLVRLVLYLGWVLSKLPGAALSVARVVLDPRVEPRPGVVHFRTKLTSAPARTLLANSITVLPGTMMVDLEGDTFIVHALTPLDFEDLASANMQRRIEAVFGDDLDEPPELYWERANRFVPTPQMLRAVRDGRRNVVQRPITPRPVGGTDTTRPTGPNPPTPQTPKTPPTPQTPPTKER